MKTDRRGFVVGSATCTALVAVPWQLWASEGENKRMVALRAKDKVENLMEEGVTYTSTFPKFPRTKSFQWLDSNTEQAFEEFWEAIYRVDDLRKPLEIARAEIDTVLDGCVRNGDKQGEESPEFDPNIMRCDFRTFRVALVKDLTRIHPSVKLTTKFSEFIAHHSNAVI